MLIRLVNLFLVDKGLTLILDVKQISVYFLIDSSKLGLKRKRPNKEVFFGNFVLDLVMNWA